jgi:glutamate synthase (NADPH/NADH) small chain
MGAEHVILAYRRSKEDMGAYEFEYDLAKGVGVQGLFNAAPIEITGNGKVTGVKFIRTHVVNGKVETIAGSEFTEEADWVIKATGQAKRTDFLSLISGLERDSKGCIKVNPDTFQTTNPKYYAAGDAVSGGQEVVNAVANGKKAARNYKL